MPSKPIVPKALRAQVSQRLRDELAGHAVPNSEIEEFTDRIIENVSAKNAPVGSGAYSAEIKAAATLVITIGVAAAMVQSQMDKSSNTPVPPEKASFALLLFVPKADRANILGDLEEEYRTTVLPKFGQKKADGWFWWQVVRTIATRNAVCRWLLIGGGIFEIGEWIVRKIGG
jgi:hypothetical protein